MRIEIDEKGTKRYYNNQEELHHEDGPAVEYSDGSKLWCINDQLHREGGPAIEWANGCTFLCLNGQHVSEEEFRHRTKPCKCPDYLK